MLRTEEQRVRVEEALLESFDVVTGLRHEDALPPLLFNIMLEWTIKTLEMVNEGVSMNDSHKVFVYMDDLVMMAYIKERWIDELYRKIQGMGKLLFCLELTQ